MVVLNNRKRISAVMVWTLLLLAAGAVVPSGSLSRQTSPREVEITAQRFHFTPSRINVEAGTRLKITLKSRDTFHGFRLEGSDINVLIPARGQGEVEVEWVAGAAGRYTFACSKPCGAGHGQMRGSIVVQ